MDSTAFTVFLILYTLASGACGWCLAMAKQNSEPLPRKCDDSIWEKN